MGAGSITAARRAPEAREAAERMSILPCPARIERSAARAIEALT